MPNRNRIIILLAAAVAVGAAIALTLSAAHAGAAYTNYLPLVRKSQPSATPTLEPSPTPTSTPTVAPATEAPTATSSPTTAGPTQQPPGCDHSYPAICVPYPPPDLDCGDIAYTNFQVVAPDDHHFDTDHDGIGCES